MSVASRTLIEEAVTYIEENLKDKLSLDGISERLCISKYHLHRLFRAITGIPLISYVRGRKLTSSLTELIDDKLNIIDIAYEYDFQYEQTYVRAFKQLFKITPSYFRQNHCELPVVQPVDTSLISDASKGVLIFPRYCMKPRFHLVGLRSVIYQEDNMTNLTANVKALDFFYNHRLKLEKRVNEHVYYGLVTYFEEPIKNYYMPSVEVSEHYEPEPPFTCETIDTCNYAVFRYVGFHSPDDLSIRNLEEIYNLIELKWRPVTKFKIAGDYHFERMDLSLCSSTYCQVDIYMPIRTE